MLKQLLAKLFAHLNFLVAMGLPLGAGGAFTGAAMQGLATWDGGNFASQAVAGSFVAAPNQIILGSTTYLILTGAPGAGFNVTTPSAQQLVQQYTTAYGIAPTTGSTFQLEIANNTNQIATLTAGTGITITGTATVAGTSNRTWLVTFTNPTNGPAAAVTFQNVGSRSN